MDQRNEAIQKLQMLAKNEKITTGKTTIGEEKGWNVFMRLEAEAVRYVRLRSLSPTQGRIQLTVRIPFRNATGEKDAIAAMGRLREMKNAFRG